MSYRNFIVIGDVMTDKYIYCDVKRFCPEGPLPIFDVVRENSMLGGAGNVAVNLDRLREKKTKMNCLFGIPLNHGVLKTRYVENGTDRLLARVDSSGSQLAPVRIPSSTALATSAPMILVSDYCKGSLTNESRAELGALSKNFLVHIDTKTDPSAFGEDARVNAVWFPSRKEYLTYPDFFNRCRYVVRKCGSKGAILHLFDNIISMESMCEQPRTVIGAGDVVLAAFSAAIARGIDMVESLHISMEIVASALNVSGTARVKEGAFTDAFWTAE